MSSPVKTSPPTALDRTGDRFGERNEQRDGHLTTTHHGLPMPGLSGRANSPTDDYQQATSSRARSTMRESSRTPPSWSVSSSTSRPRSISRRASAATSSWDFTNGPHWQQRPVSNNNGTIPGIFFLCGSKPEKTSGFQAGNMRVRLQTSSRGFVLGAGIGSVSVLQVTLRFTFDFLSTEDSGLDEGDEGAGASWDRNRTTSARNNRDNKMGPKEDEDGENTRGEQEGQRSLSISVIMTITIVTVNAATLS
ncbi:hypothetical protein F4861DRAFT_422141 [Xylaria intraflava]|nr:hypothetical protein F4861DRAFT_422141 [Xylaria intraflava]